MEHFSVLMSVYIREQAALLDRALQSILVNQSVKPSELVLVEDGPLTDGLYHVIDKYKQIFPELISVKLPQNALEGVGQLDLYYSSHLPQFFYTMLAPLLLFAITVGISWRVALVLLCCVPLIPLSIDKILL